MNLKNIISERQMPDEPFTELEKSIIYSALVPYIFKLDPKKNRVSLYLPAETGLDHKEMNGLFEAWSETIDWAESAACDFVGMSMATKMLGVILEADILNNGHFKNIYDEVVRLKGEKGYSRQRHNRRLEILIYDNSTI